MKKYKIDFVLFGNFHSSKEYYFDFEPLNSECKQWLWNILNEYQKDDMDWDLTIDDIEITKIKEC